MIDPKKKFMVLGIETKPMKLLDDDLSWWGESPEAGVRVVVSTCGPQEARWYASIQTLDGPLDRLTRGWRFEGPFRMTPEDAIRDFELAWEECRKADLRVKPSCEPPRAE